MAARCFVPLALAILITAAGCATEPVSISATENPEIRAELMFSHNGCRIYRFRDGGSPVYYADCRHEASPVASSGSTSTAWRVNCGRNCSRPVTVSTAQ